VVLPDPLGPATTINTGLFFRILSCLKAVLKAANHAEEMRHNCIKNQQNFIFETVFSTQEKLDFIQQVIDAEYFVRLFFIATDSYKINEERIKIRMLKGGHTVPAEKYLD
jgi:predicted ABC-type ATPase